MRLNKISDIGCSCLHPRRLYNRYINDWVVVPCRKCIACQKSKSNKLVGRINSLSDKVKNKYFLTLTYDNDHLPYFDFSCNELSHFDYVHKNRINEVVDPRFNVLEMSSLDDALLLNGMPDSKHQSAIGQSCFGVLWKKDLQNFFKRFRKACAYALPTFDWKYFAVGEYGCYTFRPHYHIILFSDSTVDFQTLKNCVALSWKQGTFDFQFVTHNVSSYVGSYIASSSPLPEFLQKSYFKPFHVQSNRSLFEETHESSEKFKKESYFKLPFYQESSITDGFDIRSLSSSVRNFYFPKCRGFSSIDRKEQFNRYLFFAKAVEQQKTLDPQFSLPVKNDFGDVVSYTFYCHEIYDLRKKFDNKSKKSLYRLENDYFTDIYISKKVFMLSLDLNVSVYDLVDYIIYYYIGGSELPKLVARLCSITQNIEFQSNSNYALCLLRVQYQAFELCENEDDVNFLYSLYNYASQSVALCQMCKVYKKSYPYVTNRQFNLLRACADRTLVKSVKHKDRNSYYKLLQLTS